MIISNHGSLSFTGSRSSCLSIEHRVRHHGLEFSRSRGSILCWPDDDEGHPRNWTVWRKTFDTTLLIILEFWTTMCSSAGAPPSIRARQEYGLNDLHSTFAFVSIYLFGQAIGGIFVSPVSESFGRKHVYVASTILYSMFSLCVGSTHNVSGVFAGRFLCGVVSSVPSTVVAGSIEDMFAADTRIWIIFAWGATANMGLTLGPIYSTYVTEKYGWRWVFWITSIFTFALSFFMVFIRESRPSCILDNRLKRLNKSLSHTSNKAFQIANPDHAPSIRDFITTSLTRPIRLFFTEPLVFLISIIAAIAFGQIYLLTEVLPSIYQQPPLSFTSKQASLSFVPLTLGFVLDILPRFYDHNLLKRLQAAGQLIKPEHKIRGFALGAPALAVGLWWFAWTIPPIVTTAPWIVSFLPLVLIGFATNEFDTTLAGYLTDSYTVYSSSAYAAMSFLRAVVSGLLPLFAQQMFRVLGPNWAATLLAGIATGFCGVAVLVLKFGEGWRERSRFAGWSREVEGRMGSGSGSLGSEKVVGGSGVLDVEAEVR